MAILGPLRREKLHCPLHGHLESTTFSIHIIPLEHWSVQQLLCRMGNYSITRVPMRIRYVRTGSASYRNEST
eukprot:3092026-Karenia_brevis.AAC.1